MPASLIDFVLRRACHPLTAWQNLDPVFDALKIQINISGKDLAHPGLVGRVSRALIEAQLRPQHIALELTENILMERHETALPMLLELCKLGIGLSVDDFGTGYSSLAHLGNSLGKRVIAEGIETPSRFAKVREMGCHEGKAFTCRARSHRMRARRCSRAPWPTTRCRSGTWRRRTRRR